MAAAHWALVGMLVVGCAGWTVPEVPAGRRAQYYTRQSDGAYKFGFDSEEGTYHVQDADDVNEVRGSYGADGGRTEFTAGVGGFKVLSQTKPVVTSRRQYTITRETRPDELGRPVQDTPEVTAARRRFRQQYEAAAAAAAAAPDRNIITGAVPVIVELPERDPAYDNVRYHGPPAPLGPDGNVVDEPAVAAAKARLNAIQEAAAAKAAAAVDRHIITGAVPVIVKPVAVPDDGLRYDGPLATVGVDGTVEETAEVQAATAAFHAAYDRAAAAAAAAPDRHIITARPHVTQTHVKQTRPAHHRRTYTAADARKDHPAPAVSTSQHTVSTQTSYKHTAPAVTASRHKGTAHTSYKHTARPVRPVEEAVVRVNSDGNLLDTPEVEAAKHAFQRAYDKAAAAAAAAPDRNIITARPKTAVHAGGSSHRGGARHGETRRHRVNGVHVEEADGATSPDKYGYAYQ